MGTGMNEEYRNFCSEDVEEALRPDIKILSSRTKKAMFHRDCAGCLDGRINPGQRYQQTVMILEGRFVIQDSCLSECPSAAIDANLRALVGDFKRVDHDAREMPF